MRLINEGILVKWSNDANEGDFRQVKYCGFKWFLIAFDSFHWDSFNKWKCI